MNESTQSSSIPCPSSTANSHEVRARLWIEIGHRSLRNDCVGGERMQRPHDRFDPGVALVCGVPDRITGRRIQGECIEPTTEAPPGLARLLGVLGEVGAAWVVARGKRPLGLLAEPGRTDGSSSLNMWKSLILLKERWIRVTGVGM